MVERFDVYSIITGKEDGKDRWVKIGVGFVNRDASINVILDAYPLDGKMQLRKPRVKQEPQDGGWGA